MDKTTTLGIETFREVLFRSPSVMEQELGLWVDRIGEGVTTGLPYSGRLRILGQFCHVAVLRGHGEYVSAAAGRHRVDAGDVMVQLPDDPCLYYPDGEWTTCWVTWNGAEGRVLERAGCIRSPVLRNAGEAVSSAYRQMLPLMASATAASALKRKSLVLTMLQALLEPLDASAAALSAPDPIQEVLVRLHQDYNRAPDLAALARRAGLSLTHFRRLFRAATGRSPVQYIRDLRMAEARRLLREGLPLKTVADRVGYVDLFYFMRVFKAATGCPPGEFARFNRPADANAF